MQLRLSFDAFMCTYVNLQVLLPTLLHWTKLFWIDFLQQKIETSDANNFVIFWNFIKFHSWKVIFTEMTRMTAYLNLVSESENAKSCDFREKSRIRSVVLPRTSLFVCGLYHLFGLWNAILYSETFILFKQLEPLIL